LTVWAAWFFLARVSVYEVSASARLYAVPARGLAGSIRAVAQFAPAAALGQIRPGQPAQMRLDGFPWTQYGSLPASVASVAGVVRDGQVQVELVVQPRPDSAIPLRSGLPGT